MQKFLSENGPWSQLINYRNIILKPLQDGTEVHITPELSIRPFLVPHRQEYSEVVGFLIQGPRSSILYISDIDKWEDWDALGTRVESLIAKVDTAYLDGTFYSDHEIPGRDMSSFPHPFIRDSMKRFSSLPPKERGKIRFLHLNHTNPALLRDSEAREEIERNGFRLAEEMERVAL